VNDRHHMFFISNFRVFNAMMFYTKKDAK